LAGERSSVGVFPAGSFMLPVINVQLFTPMTQRRILLWPSFEIIRLFVSESKWIAAGKDNSVRFSPGSLPPAAKLPEKGGCEGET
jgi:hypothetical protein